MKKIAFFLISFIFIIFLLSAEIIEIIDLGSVEKAIQQLNRHSLVIFDIDETLIIPKDAILKPGGKRLVNKYMEKILKNTCMDLDEKNKKEFFISKILLKREHIILDFKSLEILNKLKNNQIPALALTAMNTGTLGVIPSMEKWRIDHLKALGFDFSENFSCYSSISLNCCPQEGNPRFIKGVLCCDMMPKGKTLIYFLQILEWLPQKVVFIDDNLDYLKSVELALQAYPIEFIGFHYRAAEFYPCQLNEKLGEFQFDYLANYGEWLSDQEASALYDRSVADMQNPPQTPL